MSTAPGVADELPGVPTAYLQAYPYPAFVLRVRPVPTTQTTPIGHHQPRAASWPLSSDGGGPSRPPLLSRDTDTTVRGNGSRDDEEEGGSTPTSGQSTPLRRRKSKDQHAEGSPWERIEGSNGSADGANGSRRGSRGRKGSLLSDIGEMQPVPSSDGLESTESNASMESSESNESNESNGNSLGISTPDFTLVATTPTSTGIVWSNDQWTRVSEGRALQDATEPHAFDAFLEWVERISPYPVAVTTFTLKLHKVHRTLDVVGTRVEVAEGQSYAYVVVTATRVQEYVEDDHDPYASSTSSRWIGGRSRHSSFRAARPPTPVVHGEPAMPLALVFSPVAEQHGDEDEHLSTDAQCNVLLEEHDWASTGAGPRSSWAPEINSMISMIMMSSSQDMVWVGPDLNCVYNQPCVKMVDHPRAFGRPISEVWQHFWTELMPYAERAMSGEVVTHENDRVLFSQADSGRILERYHSWSFVPIFDPNKEVVGIYNTMHDKTEQVLTQRRLHTTRELVEELAFARSQREFYDTVADVLARNAADAPFVICYSVKEKSKLSRARKGVSLELHLESSAGVPHDHSCAPAKLTYAISKQASSGDSNSTAPTRSHSASPASVSSVKMRRNISGHSSSMDSIQSSTGSEWSSTSASTDDSWWPIARALATRQCIVVDDCSDIVKGLPVRHWHELPDMAIVIPLCSEPASHLPSGVLILGLNLFRPLDNDYEDWIQQIRGHLVSALSSVVALEEDIRMRVDKEKLERAKTAWFRGAAQEFRSPLTLIAGPLENLSQTKLAPEQRASLVFAQRNVHRLERLVTSLLNFSRLESGRLTARFVPTDLGQLISDLAVVFRPAVERLGIGFTVDIQPRIEPVCLDPVLLEMVVSNLITAALKYTPKDRSVTLRVEYDKCAIVSVSDSGLGIPACDVESVTEWYHRSKTPHDRGLDPTGMSLALAKEIVRLHEGALSIESAKSDENSEGNHGSIFKACIPLDLEADDDEVMPAIPFGTYSRELVQDITEWMKDNTSDSSSDDTGDGPTDPLPSGIVDGLMFQRSDVLLVVDNDLDMRDYIKGLFQPFCTVVQASSGTEALAMAQKSPPDLVLCDALTHHMTGLELLAQIRDDPQLRLTPVVLLSAAADDDLRVGALVAGAEDFLAKPFKPKELLLRVNLHMQMGKKRAKLETLFAAREQEMAVLSDYCPSGIMRTDAEGRVTYANGAFRQPANIPVDDPGINLWWDYCDAETRAAIEPIWHGILTGDKTTTNLKWKWLTGRTMSGVFIRLDKVRPGLSGIIACVTDISYQEEKLREAEARRVEAEESKHQQELLVDLTSHEIRTPVSAILQCSSLVKENLVALKEQLRFAGEGGFHPTPQLLTDLEEDVGALESIYQCGLVQERIAGDVLSLARIQLDMLTLHDVETDLRREARKVLSVFASEARMKKIDIRLEFGPNLDDLRVSGVKTDPVRLGQVVTNLISNAIRFTSGADVRTITVHYDVGWDKPLPGTYTRPEKTLNPPPSIPAPEDTPVYLFVSVTDTGPGMSKDETALLFQRFQQGNKMIHTRYGGSGLGLFICKKITELLGGGIEVQSELGVGSVFRFWIKTSTVAPTSPRLSGPQFVSPASTAKSLPNPADSPSAVSLSLPSDGPHVLIVEDNIINQTVLKRQLVKAGLTCDTADNGQEALMRLHEAHRSLRHDADGGYDVVLMDLEMPVMDGLTAVRHIRAAEQEGKLKPQLVIALTGNARQGQIDQALGAGMDDVVIKPYKLHELVAKMRKAVSARRASLDVEE